MLTAPRCRLDHIAVTAPDLATGAAWVRDALGAAMQPGGAHALMSTHNCLLRLGETIFLEVIAIDPAAPPPGRARWFELDELPPGAAPRLAAWVARTGDLRAAAAAASEPLGELEALARGDLRWSMAVPRGGRLTLGGAAPLVIEWHAGGEVAARLDDAGCALRRLELHHPEPDRLAAALRSIGLAPGPEAVEIAVAALPAGMPPRLIAHIDTPRGPRTLG